jgi:deoxyribodipyrimidine photolyase-related protein
MKQALVILPDQLFDDNRSISKTRPVYLFEDPLYFYGESGKLRFHKKKLILHRASMKAYESQLKAEGYKCKYIETDEKTGINDLIKSLKKDSITDCFIAQTSSAYLRQKYIEAFAKAKIKLVFNENPGFIFDLKTSEIILGDKKHYSMTSFYVEVRKKTACLMQKDKPCGGKWTFDKLNRKKLPKKIQLPALPSLADQKFASEATKYISSKFPDNPGTVDNFIYPVKRKEALEAMRIFFEQRFKDFGEYEDAISVKQEFIFHSVLSGSINIGLLTPQEVIKEAESLYLQGKAPINSAEGFIRQILGWREFIKGIYEISHTRIIKSNFWQHKNKIPDSFYKATSGIVPLDNVINKVNKNAYAHHIERLMVLGNFFLLCEIDPQQVYKWFMELFIDSYDWVMVPNVYSMSQYADGGFITTKPYISSSNYILKMSDFDKGDWCEVWDGLYWRFVNKQSKFILGNPRLSMMAIYLKKMDKNKLKAKIKTADDFLAKLF